MDPQQQSVHIFGATRIEERTPAQILPTETSRNCPYCNETISMHARKCWRCHEYFSPPREDLDDRMFQLARREVLQDCLIDIKKWITRIGVGSAAGIVLIATLSMFRFQDMLQAMVADRVQIAAGPMLEKTEEQLDETEQVLDDVQDNIRLAQYRISQFDELDGKLNQTTAAVLKIDDAKQSLETRAARLADQFEKLENRVLSAKRELRDDRERRLEESLGSFASQMVTFGKLQDVLATADEAQFRQLLASLAPMQMRRISLTSPFTLTSDRPSVVFSPSVRLEWQFEGYEVGEVIYRVHCDTQRDFQSPHAQQETTRLANLTLPAGLPHGPVYWRVEAVNREGKIQATSDVGYFEHYANSIDRIRNTGVIRVGVACSTQGEFAYFDEQQGRLTGYDIELTRWLAARLMPDMPTVRPVFMGYNWNRLLNAVRRNEVDMVISTITITPQREEEFGLKFSSPYYKTYQACVVLRDSNINSAAQLLGRRIAVQAGTSSETVAEAFTEPTDIHRVATSEVGFQDLLGGKVDAVITDYDFALNQVRDLGQTAAVIKVQETDFPDSYTGVRVEQYGIAVAKPEVGLLERLNNAIDSAKRQNILQTLKAQYVTHELEPIALNRLPNPESATPAGNQPWNVNTLRR